MSAVEKTAEQQVASKKKKKKIMIGALALLILAVLSWVIHSLLWLSTDNAQIRANTTMLSPKVPGLISKVLVEENQAVRAGDPLVEIDTRDYEAKNSGALSEVAGLRARAADAWKNYERLNELLKSGAVPQQQRDSALATAQEVSKKLQSLESQANLSQINLSDTQIRAPSDGVVAKKSAEVGMLATAGLPLIGFVSSTERWVVANFKETDLHRLQKGQRAVISVDAIPGREFEGEVESFSPATGATFTLLPPDNATGNFTKVVQRVPVRIRLKDLSADDIQLLRAGLSVEVKVRTK